MQSFYHNIPSFSGIGQQAGGQYAAQILEAGDDYIVFDLTNAYPREANLRRFTRRASMVNGVITLTDTVQLTEEGDASFTLMCSGRPVLKDDCVTAGGLDAEYDASLSPEVEEIPLTGTGLERDWSRDALFRVRLNSGRFTERSFIMTIGLHRESR